VFGQPSLYWDEEDASVDDDCHLLCLSYQSDSEKIAYGLILTHIRTKGHNTMPTADTMDDVSSKRIFFNRPHKLRGRPVNFFDRALRAEGTGIGNAHRSSRTRKENDCARF
jgi:hypothetical protein